MQRKKETGYEGQDSFIRDLLLAPTKEKERCLVADELAEMRTKLKDSNDKMRALIIARLVYLNIRGENTAFAQVEVINLMNHSQFSYKRIGYLAAATLFDATKEISILLPQAVIKDLQSPELPVQSLALALIANLQNTELSRATSSYVLKLLSSSHHIIQKRAGAAALSIIRTDPDSLDTFRTSVAKLLNSSKHGVVLCGINLASELLKLNPSLQTPWKGFAVPFTKILKTLVEVRPGKEFDFNTYNDPFLQARILRALALLKSPSEELDDLLTSLITSLDCRRNTARSILLQAAETIAATAKQPRLRSLAINQIGRLFTYKTPLVYYAALSAFSSSCSFSNSSITFSPSP